MTQEVANIEEQTAAQRLLSIVETYTEEERKNAQRTIILITQTKTLTEKIDDGSQWGKKVTRKLNVYEAAIMYEVCKEYKLNPLMNFVIFLEGNQLYITLQWHLQNAHQTGQFVGMDVKQIPVEGARNFKYEVIVKKKMGDMVVEFKGEGYANDTNVKGGKNKDDVGLMQMAEARATRRALSRAFPIGLPYAEDYYEDPNFETASTEKEKIPASVVSSIAAKPESKQEEPLETPAETEAKPADEPKAPAKKKAAAKPAETPTEEAPKPDPVGLDQIARIKELHTQLGNPESHVANVLETLKTREGAARMISLLIKEVESKQQSAKDAKEIFDGPEEVTLPPVETEPADVSDNEAEYSGDADATEETEPEMTKEEAAKLLWQLRAKLSAKMTEYNKAMEEEAEDELIESLRVEVTGMRTEVKGLKEKFWIE